MNRTRTWALVMAITSLVSPFAAPRAVRADDKPSSLTLYVGTYTGPKSKGIYQMKFDSATGAFGEPEVAAETNSPSFLCVAPNQKFLFSVNEAGKDGAVTGFKIDPADGKLTMINSQPSGGVSPCYLSCDTKGTHLMVANYSSGTVEVLPIDDAGMLGAPSCRIQHKAGPAVSKQDPATKAPEARAHWIHMDPAGHFVLACDLGLDQVLVYDYDAMGGMLSPHDPPAATLPKGTGPRHLIFSADAKFAYVVGELDGTVTVFAWDPALGTLSQIQRVNGLPEGPKGRNNSAEIVMRPDGKFLYTSNRGPDDLAIFAVDSTTGKLTPKAHSPCGGKEPRCFTIDPSGKFLIVANQNTNDIAAFKIDEETGALTPTGTKPSVASPVCVMFYAPPK